MLRSLTIAVLALLCGSLLARAQADVAGSWTLTIMDPLAINDEVPLTLEQDGEKLTGKARDSHVEGAVDGDAITMFYEVDSGQVGVITLTFNGTVDGATMEGTVAFGGYASGTWTAVRDD